MTVAIIKIINGLMKLSTLKKIEKDIKAVFLYCFIKSVKDNDCASYVRKAVANRPGRS